MKINKRKALVAITAFLALITVSLLTACQSHPQLKKVAKDAPEKPINTPEVSENIKKKYQR
ncbi:MAG TPA: hypothetical protein ACQGQH_08835 [Xylella sp.]